jgi:hypothetical protein
MRLSFEANSLLAQIECCCFGKCKLESICIPKNVIPIDGSDFEAAAIQSTSVAPETRISEL